jgi:terminal uridylyltransferase
VEADISLYNVLGRENTRLLALYAGLDDRVKQLGYLVKLFAKICDIGDASKGSLSSYAYLLMVIFYLQQVRPAVLPVLQQLGPEGRPAPERTVDGWNAWFCSDRRAVEEWSGYNGHNTASAAQLWIGFLDFYSGAFDDRGLVVAVRQKEPLTKFEKMWNSPCLAIEDPFELTHNLGSGLSRKMWLYIKRTIIKAREHFGRPPARLPASPRALQEILFDPRLLTCGAPPSDRTCFQCGRIGHIGAHCPRRAAQGAQAEGLRGQGELLNVLMGFFFSWCAEIYLKAFCFFVENLSFLFVQPSIEYLFAHQVGWSQAWMAAMMRSRAAN